MPMIQVQATVYEGWPDHNGTRSAGMTIDTSSPEVPRVGDHVDAHGAAGKVAVVFWDLASGVPAIRLEPLWTGNDFDDLPLDLDDPEGVAKRAAHNFDKRLATMREGGWE